MQVLVIYFVLAGVYGIQAGTVLQELTANPEYSIFLEWVSEETRSNLDGSSVVLTVFVPTDQAIEKFLKTHPVLADNIHWLRSIAEHCVVHGNLDLAYLKEKQSVVTGEDLPKLWVGEKNGHIYINNAEVTSSMATSNGHVHELDAVIYPLGQSSTLKEEIGFGEDYSGLNSLLVKIIEVGDLLHDATAKFTVFSPNPKAVTKGIKLMNRTQLLPVIGRHLIRDQVLFSSLLIGQNTPLPTIEKGAMINVKVLDNKVFVGSGGYWSMVESVDVSTSNGVIHVINGVLGVSSGVNIYQALGLFDSSKFGRTLMTLEFTALKDDLMDNTNMFTVFSPQNTAWDNVSTSDINTLEQILKRHVLKGKLTVDELMKKTEVTTVSGDTLAVKTENGRVYLEFDNVKVDVTSTGYLASNGIIHIIDKVIIPTDSSSVDTTSNAETNEISSTSIGRAEINEISPTSTGSAEANEISSTSTDSPSLLPVRVGVGVGVSMFVLVLVIIVGLLIVRKRRSNRSSKKPEKEKCGMMPVELIGFEVENDIDKKPDEPVVLYTWEDKPLCSSFCGGKFN